MVTGFVPYQGWRTRNETDIDAAASAYLASAASTVPLVETILGVEEWSDPYKEMLESRRDTLPAVMEPIPTQQRLWDRPMIDGDKARVWNESGNPLGQAKLRALVAPHAGDWLRTIPLTECGLSLDNEAVRVAAGLRLGLTLCIAPLPMWGGHRPRWTPWTGLQKVDG